MEDENSSQSSQIGFDSGLVKKNRIEEIRSNLLLNVSNFYTLKYIKMCFILLAIFALVWCIIYVTEFGNIYDTLLDVSDVNVNLYQTTLWTTELVSIFLSLRILFMKHQKSDGYYDFTFTAYDNKTNEVYYDEMEQIVKDLYAKLSNSYGSLEMDMPNYLSEEDLMEKYWGRINISNINETNLNNKESFPMAIAQGLSNSKTYVENRIYNDSLKNFSEFDKLTSEEKYKANLYFNYSTFIIIENSYDNLLQDQYKKLNIIPELLANHNENNKKPIFLIILLYIGLVLIILIIFFFLIHFTNKSMTDGLEKVTKIKIERIEETLKKIKTFSRNLKRFRDKDTKAADDNNNNNNNNKENSELSDDGKNNNLIENKKANTTAAKRGKSPAGIISSESNGFNTDKRKYVRLSVLNRSYLHAAFIICIHIGFIIPIFILSFEMINNTNKLIKIQTYILGNLITSSASTVDVKCFMSECQKRSNLVFDDTKIKDEIQEVIKAIALFDGVKIFYNEKFLLDACASAYDVNSGNYSQCMNDSLIKSANNTDNLIKIIDNTVNKIVKEYNISSINSPNNHTRLFNNSYFADIEKIFYNYIIPVGDNFAALVKSDLENYLSFKKNIIIILVIVLVVVIIIYSLVFGIIFSNQLVHYLSISRQIMKIIPTSVIIATQDLETWIENKY